jgi:hypothetical protein
VSFVLRLSSAVHVLLLSIRAGRAVAPVVIVAYLAGKALTAYVDSSGEAGTARGKT